MAAWSPRANLSIGASARTTANRTPRSRVRRTSCGSLNSVRRPQAHPGGRTSRMDLRRRALLPRSSPTWQRLTASFQGRSSGSSGNPKRYRTDERFEFVPALVRRILVNQAFRKGCFMENWATMLTVCKWAELCRTRATTGRQIKSRLRHICGLRTYLVLRPQHEILRMERFILALRLST